jgi:hypothetical protein
MSPFMATAKSGGGDPGSFEVPPADNHAAVCVGLVNLGTQTKKGYQGAPDRDVHEIALFWELVDCRRKDGSNFVVGKSYTFSLHEKATLRKIVESWIGRKFKDKEKFDISTLLGKSCLLGVIHEEKGERTYYKVDTVAKLPPKMQCDAPQHDPFAWSFATDDELPGQEWLPYLIGSKVDDLIAASPEWRAKAGASNGRGKPSPGGQAGAVVGAADDEKISF